MKTTNCQTERKGREMCWSRVLEVPPAMLDLDGAIKRREEKEEELQQAQFGGDIVKAECNLEEAKANEMNVKEYLEFARNGWQASVQTQQDLQRLIGATSFQHFRWAPGSISERLGKIRNVIVPHGLDGPSQWEGEEASKAISELRELFELSSPVTFDLDLCREIEEILCRQDVRAFFWRLDGSLREKVVRECFSLLGENDRNTLPGSNIRAWLPRGTQRRASTNHCNSGI